MKIRLAMAAAVVALAGVVVPTGIAPAGAVPAPLCEHRGFKHLERHGGKLIDDRWHREHHQRVTCDTEKDEQGNRYEDKPEKSEPEHQHDEKPSHRGEGDQGHKKDGYLFPHRDRVGPHIKTPWHRGIQRQFW